MQQHSKIMDQALLHLLSTYSGRDKIVRTTSYVAMLLSGATKGTTSQKFGTIAKQLSGTRCVLRLFDDLPMWLAVTKKYGLGQQEPDALIRNCSIVSNLSSQLFFPVEHIAWLAENKIIGIVPDKWWSRGIILWAISLTMNIIKGIRSLQVIKNQRANLIKQRRLESPEKTTSSAAEYRKSMRQLDDKEILEVISLIKNSLDLLNAVNWLPKGFLWAGKFPTFFSGVLGTLSSLAGIASTFVTM